MSLPDDHTSVIDEDGRALIEAVERAGAGGPVPSCPGWTVADLANHIGEVWTFWAFVVGSGARVRDDFDAYDEPPPAADDELADFLRRSLDTLLAALAAAPPDREVWTWTGATRDASWVARRMVQETAVHRWDAELAAGDAWTIPGPIAADGIDEFLQWFARRGRTESLGGTVHIHCTDDGVDGEWMIHHLDGDSIEFDRTHQKGDVAIRGGASDLLLWCWGRDAGSVEILGDPDLATRFRAGSDLD